MHRKIPHNKQLCYSKLCLDFQFFFILLRKQQNISFLLGALSTFVLKVYLQEIQFMFNPFL